MTIPYIGFGNDQLEGQPKLSAGDEILCPHCGGRHGLIDSTPSLLLFYKCGDKSYLAAIDGRSTIGVKPCVSGSLPGGEPTP